MSETLGNNRGDLTSGTPWRRIVAFAVPLLLGNIFQALYNTVDSIIVGRFVSGGALAAVGSSFNIMMVLISLSIGIGTGCSILVSQFFGAREYEKLGKTIITTFIIFVIISAVVTAAGSVFAAPILRLMNTPATIFEQSVIYLRITFLGIITIMLYNMSSGMLRGVGDSMTPLISLGIGCALNITLDLFFIIALGAGVAGAAWATVISQGVSAAVNIIVLNRKAGYMKIAPSRFKNFDRVIMLELFRLGLPSGIQQAILSAGFLVVQSVINSYGETVATAATMVMRVDSFCILPMQTVSLAMTTYVGQNIGARRLDRVNKGVRDGIFMTLGMAVTLSVILLFFGQYPMMMFTEDLELIKMAAELLRILCMGYSIMSVFLFMAGVMRGAGHAIVPTISTTIAMVGFRIPISYILCYFVMHSYKGVWYAMLLAWTANAVFMLTYYFKSNWRADALARIEKNTRNTENSNIPADSSVSDNKKEVKL